MLSAGRELKEMNMANPWEEIKLDDYENHMSLDSVKGDLRYYVTIS